MSHRCFLCVFALVGRICSVFIPFTRSGRQDHRNNRRLGMLLDLKLYLPDMVPILSSASIHGRYLVLNVAKKIVYNTWRRLHSKYLQDHQASFVLVPEICFSGLLRKKEKVRIACEKSNEKPSTTSQTNCFVLDCQNTVLPFFSSIALGNRKPTF